MLTTIIAIRPLTSPTTSIGNFSLGLHRIGIARLGNSNTDFLESMLCALFIRIIAYRKFIQIIRLKI